MLTIVKPNTLVLFAGCVCVIFLTVYWYVMWKYNDSGLNKKHRIQAHPISCSPTQNSTPPRLYTEAGHIRPMPDDDMVDEKLAPLTNKTQAYTNTRTNM